MASVLFFCFIGALAICTAMIPPLMASAGRLHILDLPGERKIHTEPIARVGGIALAVGVFVAVLMWAPKEKVVVASLVGGLIILFFGAWDDLKGLTYKAKFMGQSAGAVVVVWGGGVHIANLPLFSETALPVWLMIPFTLVALLGVTNAINLADGLDGLAGGLSLLSFGGIAYLAYLAEDMTVMLLAVSMLGGLLGFLRFNTYPARLFLGDNGSQFLGFFLGVAAIVLTDVSRGPYSPALALLLVGLPLLDTIGVMGQRLAEGRSPFLADKNHIHHKLLAAGFFHHEAVLILYAVQAGMVGLAYLLRWQSDGMVLAVYACLAVIVLSLFSPAGQGWIHVNRPAGERSYEVSAIRRLRTSWWVTELPIRLLGAGVLLFLALSVFLPSQVPADFGYPAALLFGVMVVGLAAFPRARLYLVRFGLYVSSTFVLYLSEQAPLRSTWPIHVPLTVLFAVLAVLIVIAIRFNRHNQFQTTPLDYLMVFLALIIPILPEVRIGETELSLLTAKLIIMFFAFELLLHAVSDKLAQLGLVPLWVLMGLGIRAWW